MKITVVGFWGGFPQVNEATSGYLFEYDGFNLLIDCGSAVLSHIQQYIKIEELDAVILSHYHHDHIADIGPLQYARLIAKVLGKTEDVLAIYGHQSDQDNFSKLTYKEVTTGIAYKPSEILQIGPFSIEFLETKHPVICYAMKITAGKKSVVYTADTSYFEKLESFSRGADILLCECNLFTGQDGASMGHMTSTEAGTIANHANVKQLVLTHLPHFGNHNDLVTQAALNFQGQICLAKSGLILEI